MSTSPSEKVLDAALAGIRSEIRSRLISAYLRVRTAYANGNFDNVGQRAGFFCECVLRALQDQLTGTFTPFGVPLPVFHDECVRLQSSPKSAGPESIRVIVPRAVDFLYTLRNKRGIGHIGGDVDANQIDAATCRRVCDWCVCELLRVYHQLSLEEAQSILDSLAVRELPQIWRVGGKRRLLNHELDYKSHVLVLLHGEVDGTALVEDLFEWVEHPRMSNFTSRILDTLHQKRLIEFDRETGTVVLSPKGAEKVEREILLNGD